MNQSPEQQARDHIDKQLIASGWIIQNKSQINLSEGIGVAVREYQTDVGPADYILFVNRRPVGVIEAKREDEGFHLSAHESQTEDYANAKLKYGKVSAFEASTLQTNLLTAQVSYINTMTAYVTNLATLDQTIGITLDRWHVKLTY